MDAIVKFNYKDLTEDPRSIIIAPGNNLLLNIIIGAKGRHEQLEKCLQYLVTALHEARFSCAITVVELDNAPQLRKLSLCYGAQYVFVPVDMLKTEGKFSRGAAFDIGYLTCRPSKWIMNLDNDLLVNKNYFLKLKPYLMLERTHIQPYAGRCVRRATEGCTRRILSSPATIDLDTVTDFELPARGACGGAIVVNYDAYAKVGGYDECFYDWAPEDQMFMLKLECLNGVVDATTNAHKGYCVYANDLYLLHLEHEKLWETNPHLQVMEKIYTDFCALPYHQKMHYIESKANNFQHQKLRYEQV
jgi:hypothetical protein